MVENVFNSSYANYFLGSVFMKIGDLVQYVDAWDEKGMPDLGVVIRINNKTDHSVEVFWFNDSSYMAHCPKLLKKPFALEREV